jgi:arylsulfatase A-like enzyme
MNARKTLLFVATFLAVLLLAASIAFAATPKRVLIVVMDQMRPEYAQQYDMTNVQWLQNNGAWFPNAYVGDMASETVVSHNVMVSGKLPKNMGWSDEGMRVVDASVGYPVGSIITPGDLSYAGFEKLIQAVGDYPKLGDYLHEAFPGTVVANVGQKGYQVESMAALSSDLWVRMGSATTDTSTLPAGVTIPWAGSWRPPKVGVPTGLPVPTYITETSRFYISAGNTATPDTPETPDTYGTSVLRPAWLYPEDGRYAPGPYKATLTDPGHESGDAWVADVATAIMENEDWSGLFVTFSAIDKVGHMWGAGSVDTKDKYGWADGSLQEQIHMPWAAKNADNQLGKLIAKLDELGQLDDTLIVLTADHGSTDGLKYFGGVDAYKAGERNNWYLGTSTNGGYTGGGNPNLQPLVDLNNVQFSYQSTAIETWLWDQSWPKKVQAAKVVNKLKGVIATYIRSDDGRMYTPFQSNVPLMSKAERQWWQQHGQELVNTMAWKGSADVVGLMADHVSYGVFGDHGGAQKMVQSIPMAVYTPGMTPVVSSAPMRLVDIMPTVLKAMDISLMAPVDGRAFALPIMPN